MATPALGTNISVFTMENGGVVDGNPTWTTAVNGKCYLEDYDLDDDLDTVDVTARCDGTRKNLPLFGNWTLTFTLTIPADGVALVPASWKGQYIRVIATHVVGGDTDTVIGMVKNIKKPSPKEGVLTQTITVVPTI